MAFCPDDLNDVREFTLNNIQDTEINESNIHGFGLFATNPIKKGSILCNLDGQIIEQGIYNQICKQLKPSIIAVEKYLFMECNYINETEILARTFRTKYSYINHSFRPKVVIKYFPIRIVAIVDIELGDELTIDYRCEPLTKEYLSRPEKQFLQGI
jgi:SET domain-containing protein|tara:strand:- start:782 stop:1249 length:468 start_codon:yes stop_codon:yes gene_type:complete